MQNTIVIPGRFTVILTIVAMISFVSTASAENSYLIDVCTRHQDDWKSSPETFSKWFKDNYLNGLPELPPVTNLVWTAKFNGLTGGRKSVLDLPLFTVPTRNFSFLEPGPIGYFFVVPAEDDIDNWQNIAKGQSVRVVMPWDGKLTFIQEVVEPGELVTTGVVVYLNNARICPTYIVENMAKQAKLLAENQSAFISAAERGDTAKVEKLLDTGIDFNAKNEKDESALFLAAGRGHLSTVQAILTANVDVDLKNGKYGTTALMAAAFSGRKEVVQELLEAKANVNLKDGYYGKTALMWASEMGQDDVIEILEGAGAK